MKNKGPNKEPCGTPEVTGSQSETSPFTTNLCTNQAVFRERHIYKVWSRECHDRRDQKPLKSQ